MKVALAQLNYIIGDFEGNAAKITEQIEKAKNAGADLVVFSELSVTGYYPHDLLEKKEFIRKAEETVKQIAASCNGIAAIVTIRRFFWLKEKFSRCTTKPCCLLTIFLMNTVTSSPTAIFI